MRWGDESREAKGGDLVFIKTKKVAKLVKERNAHLIAIGFEMTTAIVPEVVEEEANAWQLIWCGRWRIAAGVSLKQAEKTLIEIWLDLDERLHLGEFNSASHRLIANDRRQGAERAFDDAGSDGSQPLETHDEEDSPSIPRGGVVLQLAFAGDKP